MKHKKHKTVEEMNKEVSKRLLESLRILEILEDIIEGESKEDLLIRMAKNNVWKSFKAIEKCRKMISVVD